MSMLTGPSSFNTSRHLSFDVPVKSRATIESTYGLRPSDFSPAATQQREADLDENLNRLQEYGRQLLTGELPADVTEAVRKATAAGALARGIARESPLARGLVARDLGLMSVELQQTGAQVLDTVSRLQEGRQQYRKQFELATAEFMEKVRGMDLNVAAHAQARYEFAQKMVLMLNEQLLDLAKFREELQFKYTAAKLEGNAAKAAGPLQTIDRLLSQVRNSFTNL